MRGYVLGVQGYGEVDAVIEMGGRDDGDGDGEGGVDHSGGVLVGAEYCDAVLWGGHPEAFYAFVALLAVV